MAKPRKPDQTRRNLLRGGIAAIGAGVASGAAAAPDNAIIKVQPWRRTLGPGVEQSPYGLPSPYESRVKRRNVPWLTADTKSSINFTPLHELDGSITPNGLCFERNHSGVAEIDPAKHRLMINGMVERPLVFTLADLMRFPRENHVFFMECTANSGMEWRGPQLNGVQFTHGMIHNVMYTGVPLRLILAEAGAKPGAGWLLAEGADAAAMTRSIPMQKALDDALIAFKQNGEALRAENGYPLRLVLPGWEGNMWIKWLRRLEVGDAPWETREETSKYTDLLADGSARRFTWVMDAKSVITSPSPQAPIRHGRGPLVLSGLAWSGRAKLRHVDISLDGGINWQRARIDGAPTPNALSRFYLEIDWDGGAMLLQSRATDETGYVQPTKASLRAFRGSGSIYHNNGIQTWAVNTEGEVLNVEVS